MSTYHGEPNRAEPPHWEAVSYTVRRPGHSAWANDITTYDEACAEREDADDVARGHRVYAEQEYVGDLTALRGNTRTVEVG